MMKWINKKRNKKGFTLVELVVVIAILGILAAIAIPKLGSSRDTAKMATHNANVRILKSAAAMYLADNPDTANGTALLGDTEDELEAYIDGDKPVPYGGGFFTVKIDDTGNIVVNPDEGEEKKGE